MVFVEYGLFEKLTTKSSPISVLIIHQIKTKINKF